ncbi:unnamed protein product [Schistocephalus solidus]|uniref:TORC_N domain-containing protein n=1 Tax=Schistocephalus solidus TaxID=70667 RepID=A0A183S791_SCHSO|nr:unnamed protein product [Schistocephalus solidus]
MPYLIKVAGEIRAAAQKIRSEELSEFYETAPHKILEEVCPGSQMAGAHPSAPITRPSEMSNFQAQSVVQAKVPAVDPCKTSNQSNYSGSGDGNDFSRLIDLNSTAMANLENGILSNETLSELIQVDNRRMDQDEAA